MCSASRSVAGRHCGRSVPLASGEVSLAALLVSWTAYVVSLALAPRTLPSSLVRCTLLQQHHHGIYVHMCRRAVTKSLLAHLLAAQKGMN